MDNDHSYMRALLRQTRATPPDYPADMGNSDSDTNEVELSPGAIQREQGSNLAFRNLRALVQLGPRQNESSDTHALASLPSQLSPPSKALKVTQIVLLRVK